MKRLPPEGVQPGMETAEDVVDRSGRLLLRAGQEITERHIRIIKMWGVPRVPIASDEAQADSTSARHKVVLEPNSAAYQQAVARVKPRFRHADPHHPAIQMLFDYCLRHAVLREQQRGQAE